MVEVDGGIGIVVMGGVEVGEGDGKLRLLWVFFLMAVGRKCNM